MAKKQKVKAQSNGSVSVEIAKVVVRDDLYPRERMNATKVKEYGESLTLLPPIELNQKRELIDGKHRLLAHKDRDQKTINATITETRDDAHLLELSIRRNSRFGFQLAMEDKSRLTRQLYKVENGKGIAEKKQWLAELMSVDLRTIYNWVANIDADQKEERNATIFNRHLECRTQEEIAAEVGMSQRAIADVLALIEKFQILLKPGLFAAVESDEEREELIVAHNKRLAEFKPEPGVDEVEAFKPPIYNVWTFGKLSNEVEHHGNTEQRIAENLLWLYTKPFDIVLDPFAGGGSTLDVCKAHLRRCWIGDRKPVETRLKEIREHDVCKSLPKLPWSEVALVYLDPPYWRQAHNKYSKDKDDLANMSLPDFTDAMVSLIKGLAGKLSKDAVIAMAMQPTQWNSEPKGAFSDHVFDIIAGVCNKALEVENRISCPYSTEQCLPQMVEWSKANKKPLVLSREVVVWRKL